MAIVLRRWFQIVAPIAALAALPTSVCWGWCPVDGHTRDTCGRVRGMAQTLWKHPLQIITSPAYPGSATLTDMQAALPAKMVLRTLVQISTAPTHTQRLPQRASNRHNSNA